ncbi:MAG: 5'-3' exonuclease H3TH domain-containing protein [Bacteroidia bacterium]|nr:hypothetical protein [Bacteroidia bacterium]MDW8134162.1 5'-3' exonuclease H3TH domain-containing protein [Bacteroidia bacterium]
MRVVLIDGMALVYRAYYAFGNKPLRNSAGLNTAAPFGFLSTLIELFEELKPSHWAVAWDSAEPTFRHESLTSYKAQRTPPPEELREGLPYISRLCEALSIYQAEVSGYEADDLLAYWALQAASLPEVERIWLVSMDKDLAQLVSDKIYLYRPSRGKNPAQILDTEGVKGYFGVAPHQIPDYLALVGDNSDNLPGVRGIGEATAKRLLAEYGSLENLYKNLPLIEKSVRQKLELGKEAAFATYALACLLPSSEEKRRPSPENKPFSVSLFKVSPPNWDKLLPLLDELEFRKLKERLFALWKDFLPSKPSVTSSLSTTYHILYTPDELRGYFQTLPPNSAIAFDTETTDLHPMYAELVGIAFCAKEGEAVFCPLSSERWAEWQGVLQQWAKAPFLKIAHNLKYDWVVLAQFGVVCQGPFFDTLLADYLLDPEKPHGLEDVAKRELGIQKLHSYQELFVGLKTRDIRKVPLERLAPYACQDAELALRLYIPLHQALEKHGLKKLWRLGESK